MSLHELKTEITVSNIIEFGYTRISGALVAMAFSATAQINTEDNSTNIIYNIRTFKNSENQININFFDYAEAVNYYNKLKTQ